MKKVLLTLLGIVIVVGILAGAGFAGYRYGFVQGVTGNGMPFARGNGFDWDRMPMHDNFGWNMRPGMHRGMGGFGMLGLGGFGVLALLRFLVPLAFWGLVIWLAYKFLTGWRLTLVQPNVKPPAAKAEPVEPETKSRE